MLGVVKILAALVAVGGVGTAGAVVMTSGQSGETATVRNLVDGDTLDVDFQGRVERIRLLNIDTPETKDPNEAVQCLGPEAASYLATLIPVGTTVTLEYDRQRTDRYGRTLAGVFTSDRRLVNAEVARQGFANTVVVDGNDRFFPPVEAARAEAAAVGRGLYSSDEECTLPARVEEAETAAAGLASADPAAAVDELESAAAEAESAVALVVRLETVFLGPRLGHIWAAVPADEQQRLGDRVAAARESAQRSEAETRAAATAARVRETAEAAEQDRQARAAEQQRAVEAAERAAGEARERNAREAEASQEQQKARAAEARPKPKAEAAPREPKAAAPKPDPGSSGSHAGYTGPRCYAPGGKTWKPC